MKRVFFCIVILSFIATGIRSQTLTVRIYGIRNSKGNIQLAFFTNDKDFKAEKPSIVKIIKKSSVKNGCVSVSYTDIRPGTYGIALLDDENKDGDMTFKCFVPVEGFGFSNYNHSGMSKPSLSKFSFNFNTDITVRIKVKYI